MRRTPTFYDTLGVSPAASAGEISRSFRELAKIYHPDSTSNLSEESRARIFAEITSAYETLKDPDKRAAYDETLEEASGEPVIPRSNRSYAFWWGAAAGLGVAMACAVFLVSPQLLPWSATGSKFQDSLSAKVTKDKAAPVVIDMAPRKEVAATPPPATPVSVALPPSVKPQPQAETAGTVPVPFVPQLTQPLAPPPAQEVATVPPPQLPAPQLDTTESRNGQASAPRQTADRSTRDQTADRGTRDAASPPPRNPASASRLSEEIAALEARMETGDEAQAAYRLLSLIASVRDEEDLRRAVSTARREPTVQLIKERLAEMRRDRSASAARD
jgi:curved DNA-binding protein CbpA